MNKKHLPSKKEPRRALKVRPPRTDQLKCTENREETTKVPHLSSTTAAAVEKAMLLAQASHEIKTPLASILGFTESLLSHGHLTDDDRQDVIAIRKQSEYMNGLISDLLDLARIDGHKLPLQYQRVNAVHLIDEVIQAIRIRFQDKDLPISVDYPSLMPARIRTDPLRLQQVLNQVLENAYNFTFEGHLDVRVKMTPDSETKSHLRIQIQDSGIGMGEETQKRIFKPFMRGDFPEVQKTQGTGLGLPLAKSLMREMGGELRLVTSEIGVGSIFEISLSFDPTQTPHYSVERLRKEQSLADMVSEESDLGGQSILVVDDSVDLRLLMRRYLNKAGAKVETSENGAEAVSKALHKNFDCILMDIRMPIMNGYEATQLLRQSGYERPIIALTAQATEEDQRTSGSYGFTAYLSKPVNMSYLKQILQENHP